MGEPVVPVLHAAPNADDSYGQLMQDGSISDELVGAQSRESHNGIAIGLPTCLCQSRSHSDHVLFSDASVKKSVGMGFDEGFERHETEVAGEEDDLGIQL